MGNATDVYGALALVIGILVWIALGGRAHPLCAELNVVWNRHLWPET